MTRHAALFAFATLLPAGLIALAAVQGGVWVIAALLALTLVTTLADRLLPEDTGRDADATGTTLSVLLALVHLALLALVVWALAGDAISRLEKVALFFAAGLYFGQVSNANAHELIHRPQRTLHRLGMWVYISLLFGHHTSAHVLVHHRHVATYKDPNTSRRGEGFYRYLIRAWAGSFTGGYRAEKERLARIGRPAWRNPYWVYLGGGAAFVALAYLLGGTMGMVLYVALAGHAQTQLLLSDYVQHYGLTRKIREGGKPEPVAAKHSWNSPHLYSSSMLLNATRHSDHHARPARAYPALELPGDAPVLPRPLPLMASIALVPPLWRRIMDPLTDRWRDA
ncbi:alkane 1-monooxygenase [Yoonia sp.]|uniref:alkane 1-monooxygenase n=1 Tax=Yoonia sp. TaxID=2212373 RepID=UPI00391AC9C7